MPDHELVRTLLQAAECDLKTLEHMLNPEAFDDQIFGFYAQQALEKALKAWLHSVAGEHPFAHDLSLLLNLLELQLTRAAAGTAFSSDLSLLLNRLEKQGVDVSLWWGFLDLSGFYVRFRYEMFPDGEELLDRELLAVSVRSLVQRVRGMVFPTTA